MPLVYRAMPWADDDLPAVEPRGLGLRPGEVDFAADGLVACNGKGMSVAPNWRDLNATRIPKRLRHLFAGAAGSNNFACFRYGEGPFQTSAFAGGLFLTQDSLTHGAIGPDRPMPLHAFLASLAATRSGWTMDET